MFENVYYISICVFLASFIYMQQRGNVCKDVLLICIFYGLLNCTKFCITIVELYHFNIIKTTNIK